MTRPLDDLLARVSPRDRLFLIGLCDEYLQSVLGRNNIIRSMWAHPESWGAERRDSINVPSRDMVDLQATIKAEFARVFGPDADDVRKQVFCFLLGQFDV